MAAPFLDRDSEIRLRDLAARGDVVAKALVSLINQNPQKTYTNATRPSPANAPFGGMIWNTDDNAPNFSDGTNWRDVNGNIT